MRAPRFAPRLPDFVVAGAQRSGSSSLFRYLLDHPDVFMARDKEVRFFDLRYEQGLDWYRSRFAGAAAHQRAGEASPAYLCTPRALERLAADLPDARILVILRDPVHRAYSHYWLERSRRREARPWEQVVAESIASPTPGKVIAASRYSVHLARLFANVARNRCLVLSFDRLAREPADLFADVCRFVGVRPMTTASVGRKVNAHFEIRSHTLRRLAGAPAVPRRVRNAVGRLNHVVRAYPPMERGIRAELDAYFEPDREALEQALRSNELPGR